METYQKPYYASCMKGEAGIMKVKVNRFLKRMTIKIYFRGKRVSKEICSLNNDRLDLLESMKNPDCDYIKEIWVMYSGSILIDSMPNSKLQAYESQFTNYDMDSKVKKILAKERLKTI